MDLRSSFGKLSSFELHKQITKSYIQPNLKTSILNEVDKKAIEQHSRFIWDKEPELWEEKFAKRYYDKLFKEYAICDLTKYKKEMIALRWRTEKEVISGKGQFVCGNKHCSIEENLRSWEVNFKYYEFGEKKNNLVKLRLCPECSAKLNFGSKKREVKRLKKKTIESTSTYKQPNSETSKHDNDDLTNETNSIDNKLEVEQDDNEDDNIWKKPMNDLEVSREDEFESYLTELLL